MEPNYTSSKQSSGSIIDTVNLGLVIYLIKKTLPLVIVMIMVASALGFFYLKYTNKIYQGKATLLLQEQKQQELLGVQDLTQIENFDLSNVTVDAEISSYDYDADFTVDDVSLEEN